MKMTPPVFAYRGDRIVDEQAADECRLDFSGAIAFPGLINSHDHLDFNCFHPLNKKTYSNYKEWGNDIHQQYKKEIDAVLKIPQELRTRWGMYKNLLAGVTTVVNHGGHLFIEDPLIRIEQKNQSLHSPGFEKNWKRKLNNPFLKNRICVIHAGEGINDEARHEIDELINNNLLRRKIVVVHGVAMAAKQAEKCKAMVWCPESNNILLNAQPEISALKDCTVLLFGTDSTLTGRWNIWDHLRFAKKTGLANDKELMEMISTSPARIWGLNSGSLEKNKDADIVIVKGTGNFFEIDPSDILMVLQQGKITLFDETMLHQLQKIEFDVSDFEPVEIAGTIKFIPGGLHKLIRAIREYYPQANFPCGIPNEIKTVIHA